MKFLSGFATAIGFIAVIISLFSFKDGQSFLNPEIYKWIEHHWIYIFAVFIGILLGAVSSFLMEENFIDRYYVNYWLPYALYFGCEMTGNFIAYGPREVSDGLAWVISLSGGIIVGVSAGYFQSQNRWP